MNQATALMGLITETSLHAGAGSSAGVVDLPIQREGHNGWPCVFGSSVKGSLRDRGENILGRESNDLFSLFGPDTQKASDHAGALSVGDARLLLLPVRSLTSAFRWVTCPEALNRLKRDAERMGLKDKFNFAVPSVTGANAAVAKGSDAAVAEGSDALFLEEYRFNEKPDEKVHALPSILAQLVRRDAMKYELAQRLVVVSDDLFSALASTATQINAHIALDSVTKTTNEGSLWYEETLPPETLLYAPLMANKGRRQDHPLEASDVMGKFKALFSDKPWLQLGGNETLGMGWCAVRLLEA